MKVGGKFQNLNVSFLVEKAYCVVWFVMMVQKGENDHLMYTGARRDVTSFCRPLLWSAPRKTPIIIGYMAMKKSE